MRRLLPIALVAGALFSIALFSPSRAIASVEPMSLAALSVSADSVIEVTVVSRASRHQGRSSQAGLHRDPIVTEHRLRVGRVLKGTRTGALELVLPGGTVDTTTLKVSEVPELTPGQRYLLFLDRNGIVGGPQGSFRIVSGRIPALDMDLADVARAVTAFAEPVYGPVPGVDISALQQLASTPIAEQTGDTALLSVGVTSFAPSVADAGIGQVVTISGAGFGSIRGSVHFMLGTSMTGELVAATNIVSWSDSQVRVEVPRRAQSGPVFVTTAAGVTHESTKYAIGFSAMGARWPTMPVMYHINENTGDMTGESSAIRAAMSTWNEAGSHFRALYAGASDMASADPPADGQNDIGFASTGFPAGVLAWNAQWYYGGYFFESDITFNDAAPWGNGASASYYDLETVALHELGHTVGLGDQYGDVGEVMAATSRDMTRRTLTAAELRGARWVNGVPVVAVTATPTVWFDAITDSTLTLGWRPADHPDVVSYRIYERDRFIGEYATTSAAFVGHTPGATYRFAIQGVDEFGFAIASYPVFEVGAPTGAGVVDVSAESTAIATTAPALGIPDASFIAAFDTVLSPGTLWITRTPTLAAPLTSARALLPGWSMLFNGTHTGSVTATVPVDPRLPMWRRAGLSAMRCDSGIWSPIPAEYDTASASVAVTLPRPMTFVLTEDVAVDASSRLVLDTASSVLKPAYGRSGVFTVRLTDVVGGALGARSVKLHSVNGTVVGSFTEVVGKTGTYRITAPLVRSKTAYSVRFASDGVNSASTLEVSVQPYAALTVAAPTSARRYRAFTVWGTIRPSHKNAVVKIEAARRGTDGVYRVTRKYWTSTSTSSVRKPVALSPGRWRIRLVHSDTSHASSVSRWDYLTVK